MKHIVTGRRYPPRTPDQRGKISVAGLKLASQLSVEQTVHLLSPHKGALPPPKEAKNPLELRRLISDSFQSCSNPTRNSISPNFLPTRCMPFISIFFYHLEFFLIGHGAFPPSKAFSSYCRIIIFPVGV